MSAAREARRGLARPATQARQDALRERLVDAAARAVEDGGILQVRARALAESAGCAVGAIYGVFPDLDALVLAVNARTLDELGAAMGGDAAGHPADELVRLALAYLGFAASHRQRWRALFQHRLPPGRELPEEYAARLRAAFLPIEGPLERLRPELDGAALAALARTLFSAVHGVVDLGLDEKLAEMPPTLLAGQVEVLVRAAASGLGIGAA